MTISMESALEHFENLRPASKRKIEIYAKRCYLDFMNSETTKAWEENRGDKDWERALTRPWYDLVHSCSTPTGLITQGAYEMKMRKGLPTKDHCFRPQFVYRFMLDNHSDFEDFEVFRKWFIMCTSTIFVTGKENDNLSLGGTNNRGDDYEIVASTDQQYIFADLPLYKYSNETRWNKKRLAAVSNLIEAPQALLDYEKKFIRS
jgi:hypothetical protein